MERQGAYRAESGSRWAELHENLAYCMFNLVGKHNFGSESHSGLEHVKFLKFWVTLKKSWKIQNFMLVLGVRKKDFYEFSKKVYEENPEYGNLEWDDDSGNLEWDDGALLPRGNGFSVLRISTKGPIGPPGSLEWDGGARVTDSVKPLLSPG